MAVGEAREQLQRALLFGTDFDIADAEAELEHALNCEAAARKHRRHDSIQAAMVQLDQVVADRFQSNPELWAAIERADHVTPEQHQRWTPRKAGADD